MNLIRNIIHKLPSISTSLGWMGCIILATTFLSGCTLVDEELTDCIEEPEKSAQELYITLTVTMPLEAETRSFTTNEGNASDNLESGDERLPGTDEENTLLSATIYFVDNNYNIKLQLETEEFGELSTSGSTTLKAKIENLSALADLGENPLKILVVANAQETSLGHNFNESGQNTTQIAGDAVFSVTSLTGNPIGKFGDSGKTMPFVNANDNVKITFPSGSSEEEILAKLKACFESNGKGEAIWNLTKEQEPIDLERAVARLEYKDASDSNNTYQISNTEGVQIQLYFLQPFNINTSSYLFRHTAMGTVSDGKSYASSEAKIFGVEKGSGDNYNWVAGSDWTFEDGAHKKEKNYLNSLGLKSETNGENWFYPYQVGNGSTDGIVYIDDIANVYNNSSPSDGDGYHPFYYVTENVLPSTSLMKEESNTEGELSLLEQNATGVAFTFVVLGKDNKPLKYSSEPEQDYPNGITNVDGDSEYKKIKITDINGGWIELTPVLISEDRLLQDNSSSVEDDGEENEVGTAAVDEGETGNENSDEGNYYYLLTYVGCIAHNNDSSNTGDAIAPMMYGVVRNNTYQLSISSVNDLPIPNTPENQYFSLEIRVLAWAKRDIHVVW